MKAYKIVSVRDGKFYSYIQYDRRYKVQYYTDGYATPNFECMPLFCCPSMDSVRLILDGTDITDIKVFECDIIKHKGELHSWVKWAEGNEDIVFASKVLLLKEVFL